MAPEQWATLKTGQHITTNNKLFKVDGVRQRGKKPNVLTITPEDGNSFDTADCTWFELVDTRKLSLIERLSAGINAFKTAFAIKEVSA
jgi:ribosomal protein S4E